MICTVVVAVATAVLSYEQPTCSVLYTPDYTIKELQKYIRYNGTGVCIHSAHKLDAHYLLLRLLVSQVCIG